MLYLLFILVLLIIHESACGRIKFKDENELRGVVLLDPITFPKIIPSGRYSTIVLFCNKATLNKGDYAVYQRDQFATFTQAGDLSSAKDVLFAQVIINGGYGASLAERAGVLKNAEIPQVILYKKGSKKPNRFPFVRMNVATLRRFAHKHTGFWYPGPHNIRSLDDLTLEFMEANDVKERENIVEKAEQSLKDLEDIGESRLKLAKFYIHCMKKVLSEGFEWAEKETARLYGLISKESKNFDEEKMGFIDAKLDIASLFDQNAYMDPNREIPETYQASEISPEKNSEIIHSMEEGERKLAELQKDL